MTGALDAEALIVGAGPAGSALAGLLAARGVDVLVVDRASFPREKACGECVNPGGVATLDRLGLLEAVERTGPVRLQGWDLQGLDGRRVPARFPEGAGHALGIRRGPFDSALLEAARARGARFRERMQVQSVDLSGPHPVLQGRPTDGSAHARPWSLKARLVIGADGLRSVVARAIGAPPSSPRKVKASLSWHLDGAAPDTMTGSLLLGGPFTSGLAPVGWSGPERAIWTQTIVVDPRRYGRVMRSDPDALRRRALEHLRPADADRFRPLGEPRGSGPFDRPVQRIAHGPVLLVGDAAGYFDPLTGQGIYRALRSAELAAPVLLDALTTPEVAPDALAPHERAVRREFGPGRRLQWLIDRTLERTLVRTGAMWLLDRIPGLADTLVGVTGDVLPPRALAGALGRAVTGRGRNSGPGVGSASPTSARDQRPSEPFDSPSGCL